MRGGKGFAFTFACAALAAPLSACGGSRQDAHEPSGNFTVSIVQASFPATQHVSKSVDLRLVIRNESNKTIPNLAVTLDSLASPSQAPNLANPQRPVWILDRGPGTAPTHSVEGTQPDNPGGDVTAYVSTWAVGPVRPHRQRTFVWSVTPVQAGQHRVSYTVAAGLNGKARAQLPGGQEPRGSFTVSVSGAAAQVHVDPNTGQVVSGPPPLGAG